MVFSKRKKIILYGAILLFIVILLNCYIVNSAYAQGELFRGIQECRERGDCTPDDALRLIVNVANILMKVIGVAALVMFCVGGIHWLTAGGRPAQVKRGKDIIIGATMGLFFVFFSWFIVRAIQDIFQLEREYKIIGWADTSCRVMVDEKEIPAPDGTPCGEPPNKSDNQVCKCNTWNKQGKCTGAECVDECTAYYGDKGYKCVPITCECETDTCKEEELDQCASDKGCMRYLCPGGNLEMCCK